MDLNCKLYVNKTVTFIFLYIGFYIRFHLRIKVICLENLQTPELQHFQDSPRSKICDLVLPLQTHSCFVCCCLLSEFHELKPCPSCKTSTVSSCAPFTPVLFPDSSIPWDFSLRCSVVVQEGAHWLRWQFQFLSPVRMPPANQKGPLRKVLSKSTFSPMRKKPRFSWFHTIIHYTLSFFGKEGSEKYACKDLASSKMKWNFVSGASAKRDLMCYASWQPNPGTASTFQLHVKGEAQWSLSDWSMGTERVKREWQDDRARELQTARHSSIPGMQLVPHLIETMCRFAYLGKKEGDKERQSSFSNKDLKWKGVNSSWQRLKPLITIYKSAFKKCH